MVGFTVAILTLLRNVQLRDSLATARRFTLHAMRILAAVLALACSLSMEAQGRRRAVRPSPAPPAICEVQGLAGVFRSEDGGQTFSGNGSTAAFDGLFDMEFLEDPPQTVIGVSLRAVYDSLDGGCTWTKRHTITKELHHPVNIAAGPNGRAFLFSDEILLRYDQSSIVELTPPLAVGTLFVDPGNREHVRMFGIIAGGMFESFDGGATWTNRNRGVGTIARGGAFDPGNFDHMLVVTNSGVQSTRDAGASWTTIRFNRTVCDVQFVRGMPNVVWTLLTIRAGSDTVYRSEDGGASFQDIAEVATIGDAEGACLSMVAHPFDADRAVVVFRDLHTIDAIARNATISNCCNANLGRTAYSRVDRDVVLVFASRR
jgi:photosystem II stability/assembly factor-like uncharacterized protein